MSRTISVVTISSVIISILVGAIPGFQPLNYIYQALFHQDLPSYILLGFSAIGILTLYYTLLTIFIFAPLACYLHTDLELPANKFLLQPSAEDFLYLLLLYIAYIYACYTKNLLTTKVILLGFLVILLPFIYRLVTYTLHKVLEPLHTHCFYPAILFTFSFVLDLLVSIPYLYLLHTLEVIV